MIEVSELSDSSVLVLNISGKLIKQDLDAAYIGYFDRIAIVGEKKWQEWGTQLVDAISKEELKYFYTEQAEKAWKWLNTGDK